MKDSKYVKMLRTVVVTGGAFIINLLIQLLLTPYITRTVGTEAYGFVTLAKDFAQYAAIITAALNSFASRYIAVEYHNDRLDTANVYFSSTFFGDAVLGGAIMAIAAAVILFLDSLLNVPAAIVSDVKLLFLLVFLRFLITTVFSVFEAPAYVKDKLYVAGIFKGLSYVAEAASLIALFLVFPTRIYFVGASLVVASTVIAAGNVWISKRYTPQLRVRRKDYSLAAVKRLVVDGVWTSVNSLGEMLNNGLDLMICNLMLSPLHMGQVAIAKTVHTMFSGMFVVINPAFQPMFLKSYAANDKKTLLEELKLSMKLSGMMSNIIFAGFAALGPAFYQLWIPHEDTRQIYLLTLINCITLVPGGPMQPLYYIYTLTLKKKLPCLITIAGGLCNVLGMYPLIRFTGLGVYSVVWTTAAVMAVINYITNPLYMAHVLRLPAGVFYPSIVRNTLSCAALTAVYFGLSKLYTPGSWIGLAGCAVVYALAGAALHLLIVCSQNERKRIGEWIRKRGN